MTPSATASLTAPSTQWMTSRSANSAGVSKSLSTIAKHFTIMTRTQLINGIINYAFETDTECCFDVMAVGKTVVKKYAFGAGEDAELTK